MISFHVALRATALLVAWPIASAVPAQQVSLPDSVIWMADPASIPNLPFRRSIRDAEVEGASFARRPATDTVRANVLANYVGTADRKCIRPGERQSTPLSPATPGTDSARSANPLSGAGRIVLTVHAGDFAIGGGLTGRGSATGKVWWSPLHDPRATRSGLLVRAARVDPSSTPADTVRYVSLDYARPVSGPDMAFFPTGFHVPSTGTWLAIATVGADWGCVIMDGLPSAGAR